MKRQGLPLRKYLFYGLTIVLASFFIFLAVQGRRIEKEQLRQGAGIVQNYKPTPTRVLAPGDLEIISFSMAPPQRAGRHEMEIRNSGDVSYCEIRLSLSCFDASGNAILELPFSIKDAIPPGETLLAADIPMKDIPAGAADCRPGIVYADIEP
ncbi:MAG: hypothetical protein JW793_05735 [Acidobacteria bacterium]|nr:hypothetical protein [Acidobacteriota bacterium]